jgi:uroporphyrinogen decarboxylase
MNGKELIFKVFESGRGDRLPWVPFAGIHAGKLKNYTAREVLEDEDKLFESLLEVNKIYQPDGQPVVFDLQLEAEVLGCELMWEENSPPTVKTHPLSSREEIPNKIPQKDEGRIGKALSVTRRLKEEIGDSTALYGLICGPFTLASHLRGTDLFMDLITNKGFVEELLEYTTKIAKKMAEYYIESGADIIAAVDPMVSQISPDHFNEYLKEVYLELFSHIKNNGAYSSFFVCGDASANIEAMCKTRPDNISIDENISLQEAKNITDKYDIVLGGNIPLTTVMLLGSQQDNMKWVIDTLDKVSKNNLIISPGCDMPYDVPVENAVAVEQAVHQPAQVRDMVNNYQTQAVNTEAVELPNYSSLDKVLVEVFTLDSATCAACTYMKAAALKAEEYFGDEVEVKEYKYNNKENIARITKMGVEKLPSIYVNGKLKFSSIVPNKEELMEVIKECQQKK